MEHKISDFSYTEVREFRWTVPIATYLFLFVFFISLESFIT